MIEGFGNGRCLVEAPREAALRVREVEPGDLARLERDLPSGPAQVHRAHLRSVQTGATTYLAARERGQARGTGVIRWSGPVGQRARSRYAEVPEIAHLQVGERHSGKGVGSAIIAAAESMIAGRSHAQAAVGVDRENPRARALYLRLGYRPTGLIDTLGYTWVDPEGVKHPEVEHIELLVKQLLTGQDGPAGAR